MPVMLGKEKCIGYDHILVICLILDKSIVVLISPIPTVHYWAILLIITVLS